MKERIRKNRYIILPILIVLLCGNVFADMTVPDFNGVGPQNHINKIYSAERKNELKTGNIKYDDIDDIIHIYNPEVLNNWNSWSNNKSANDVYEEYQDAADTLSGGGGDSEVQNAMIMAQADAMQIQADKSYSDSYIDFLTYLKVEKSIALQTKILYINYFKSDYALYSSTENFAEATRKAESVKNNYKYGNATKVEYLQAEKAKSDANSAYVIADSNRRTYLRNLLINCGRSMNDEVIVEPKAIDVTNLITTINLDQDYEKALKNNYQFEIYKKGKENARSTEVKNEMQINIDAAPQKIYNDIETKYRTILDAIDANKNKEIALNLARDTFNQAKNSYNHGSISKKDYQSVESQVKIAENDLLASAYDITIAYLNYIAAVDGLASC